MKNPSNGPARLAFLENEIIKLCPLEGADAEGGYPAWLNDAEVCRGNSHGRFPYTAAQAREFVAASVGRRDQIVLAMVERGADRHVGNVALQSIDLVNRNAELAILLGERDVWGKGYGKAACELLVRHAFDELGLERIHCGTFETNIGMQRVALALGMKEEGRRRRAVFKGGRYLDVLEYGLLRSEYQ